MVKKFLVPGCNPYITIGTGKDTLYLMKRLYKVLRLLRNQEELSLNLMR